MFFPILNSIPGNSIEVFILSVLRGEQHECSPRGVPPLDHSIKLTFSNNILAQRGHNETAERPPKGEYAYIIEFFIK